MERNTILWFVCSVNGFVVWLICVILCCKWGLHTYVFSYLFTEKQIFCLQILHPVKERADRLCHCAICNNTGKICNWRSVLIMICTECMYCRCVYFRMFGQMCTCVCFVSQRDIRKSNQHILPPLISSVDRLARDDTIRHSFAHDPECWKAFLAAIVSNLINLFPKKNATPLFTWMTNPLLPQCKLTHTLQIIDVVGLENSENV